jgi:hypothetical protein
MVNHVNVLMVTFDLWGLCEPVAGGALRFVPQESLVLLQLLKFALGFKAYQ